MTRTVETTSWLWSRCDSFVIKRNEYLWWFRLIWKWVCYAWTARPILINFNTEIELFPEMAISPRGKERIERAKAIFNKKIIFYLTNYRYIPTITVDMFVVYYRLHRPLTEASTMLQITKWLYNNINSDTVHNNMHSCGIHTARVLYVKQLIRVTMREKAHHTLA